jgi:hypothetical protein
MLRVSMLRGFLEQGVFTRENELKSYSLIKRGTYQSSGKAVVRCLSSGELRTVSWVTGGERHAYRERLVP